MFWDGSATPALKWSWLLLLGSLCSPSWAWSSDARVSGRANGEKALATQFEQGLCGQTVTASVVLTRDIANCAGDGIIVGADDVVVDGGGHLISGTGAADGIRSTDRSNVTIKNCVIRGFDKGVHLESSTRRYPVSLSSGHTVTGNTLTGNQHGVFLRWSRDVTIAQNRLIANHDSGVSLAGWETLATECSNGTTITGNSFTNNKRGLVTWCPYKQQAGNLCQRNSFVGHLVAVTDRYEPESRMRYRSNSFAENLNTVFYAFHGGHSLTAGSPREFDISVHASDGSDCTDFTVKGVSTSPREEVSFSRSGHHILGSFTPRRAGLYSLYMDIEGCGQASIGQRYWFGREESTTLYLAEGPRNDVGRLLAEPPSEPTYVYCTMWIEAAVQDPPEVQGIAKITRVDVSMLSNYRDQEYWLRALYSDEDPAGVEQYNNVYALEFGRTYSRRGDVFVTLDGRYPNACTWVNESIHKGCFIHRCEDWPGLAVKYWGRDPDWYGEPADPSTVRFSYLVTDSPVIQSVSRDDVRILSATAQPGSATSAELVLWGRGPAGLSVRMGDPDRLYSVSLDGVPCERSPVCDSSQSEGDIRLEVVLASQHTISIVSGAD